MNLLDNILLVDSILLGLVWFQVKNAQLTQAYGGNKGIFFSCDKYNLFLWFWKTEVKLLSETTGQSLPLHLWILLPLFRTQRCEEFQAAFIPASNPIKQRDKLFLGKNFGLAWVMCSPLDQSLWLDLGHFLTPLAQVEGLWSAVRITG